MSKVLAIINPISGTGSKKSIPDLLARAYAPLEHELLLTYTKAAGHAEELARRAAEEGYGHVIAVDGDPTTRSQLLDHSVGRHRQAKSPCQSIARTLRDDR